MISKPVTPDIKPSFALSVSIRVIGFLFIANGVWSCFATFMRWSHPFITANLFGVNIDLGGIVSVMVGYSLLRIQESGRWWALIMSWIKLGILVVVSGTVIIRGNTDMLYKFASFQYQSTSPLLFSIVTVGALMILIGLIVFLSSSAVKDFFRNHEKPSSL